MASLETSADQNLRSLLFVSQTYIISRVFGEKSKRAQPVQSVLHNPNLFDF